MVGSGSSGSYSEVDDEAQEPNWHKLNCSSTWEGDTSVLIRSLLSEYSGTHKGAPTEARIFFSLIVWFGKNWQVALIERRKTLLGRTSHNIYSFKECQELSVVQTPRRLVKQAAALLQPRCMIAVYGNLKRVS